MSAERKEIGAGRSNAGLVLAAWHRITAAAQEHKMSATGSPVPDATGSIAPQRWQSKQRPRRAATQTARHAQAGAGTRADRRRALGLDCSITPLAARRRHAHRAPPASRRPSPLSAKAARAGARRATGGANAGLRCPPPPPPTPPTDRRGSSDLRRRRRRQRNRQPASARFRRAPVVPARLEKPPAVEPAASPERRTGGLRPPPAQAEATSGLRRAARRIHRWRTRRRSRPSSRNRASPLPWRRAWSWGRSATAQKPKLLRQKLKALGVGGVIVRGSTCIALRAGRPPPSTTSSTGNPARQNPGSSGAAAKRQSTPELRRPPQHLLAGSKQRQAFSPPLRHARLLEQVL